MQLLGRVWRVVTSFLSIAGLSPFEGALEVADQIPLSLDLDTPSSQPPPEAPLRLPPGPIFKPPGGLHDGDGSNFTCNYTLMAGFRECSTPENRGCWLTNGTFDWNITTNYEAADEKTGVPFAPMGMDRYYELTVKKGNIVADGLNFTDGKWFDDGTGHEPTYPGPWIQACWGDTIHVKVKNELYGINGTSIHWHGIRQWLTMHMDGVNGITQCPIAPGDNFTYTFRATQYGSSWYHSHYSIQYADGLVGPISIHGPTSEPYDVAPEIPLLLTDWAHNSAFNVLSNGGNMEWPSILINGQGNVTAFQGESPPGLDPSKAKPYTLVLKRDQQDPTKTQRHLLRIINTSFDSTFIFSIDDHLIKVVEVDFVPIHGWPEDGFTESITISIGQRYNIIVESLPRPQGASDDSDSYWIRTYIPKGSCTSFVQPGANAAETYMKTGILRYSNTSTGDPTSKPWASAASQPCLDFPANFRPVVPWYVGKPSNGDPNKGELETINSTRGHPSPIKDFVFAKLGLEQAIDTSRFTAFRIDFGNPSFLNLDEHRNWAINEVVVNETAGMDATKWIYLTISNAFAGTHPMHLHGHDFAILNVSKTAPVQGQEIMLNLNNPPRRDVVLIPAKGFAVIAFRADNPGTWLMHCHIARHAAEGLGLQILERLDAAQKIWPNDGSSKALNETQRVCNNWNAWLKTCTPKPRGVEWTCRPIFQDDSGV